MLKKYYWVLYFVVLFLSIMATKISPNLSVVVLSLGLGILVIYGVSKKIQNLDSVWILISFILCIYNIPFWFSNDKKHFDLIHNFQIISTKPYYIKFSDNNITHVKKFPVPNCPKKIVIIKETVTYDFWLATDASKKVKYYIGCKDE